MFEFERTVSQKSLWEAWKTIKIRSRNKSCGIDQIDVGAYAHEECDNINLLHYSLISGLYQPYREKKYISKKNRSIYISCLEDKIVQTSIAQVLSELITFHPSVHSFIKGRSIFTAYSKLKKYLSNAEEFYKVDIEKFYESIPKEILLKKIERLSGDRKFLDLIETMLMNHPQGISTGSSLSPVLSNIYLMDFDQVISNDSAFYLRYVDDMLIAPQNTMKQLIQKTKEELEQRRLKVNESKSKVVNTMEGFQYLGFEIKKQRKIEELIYSGKFSEAETQLNSYDAENELSLQFEENVETNLEGNNQITEQKQSDHENNEISFNYSNQEHITPFESPEYILEIEKNCHIVNYLVNKAQKEQFLSYPEKKVLLYLYKCLKDDGEKHLHKILGNCMDYDYNITQGYIERCRIQQPMGCKKICDLFEDCCDKSKCNCNFHKEKIYPTPLIHAMRQKRDCFTLPKTNDNIGHFKKLSPKQDIHEMLESTLLLNKQMSEIKLRQKICKDRLENLFEKNGYTEIETPQGLLIKNEEGFFIKL